MKIAEMFASIQGEGMHQGIPALFIRTSGCTRACSFCDTVYHTDGEEKSVKEVAKDILTYFSSLPKGAPRIVVWTGGEPLMYAAEIKAIQDAMLEEAQNHWEFHVESNGDLIEKLAYTPLKTTFDYICFSPKDKKTMLNIKSHIDGLYAGGPVVEIKVVTDLISLNMDLLDDATSLMPLTTGKWEEDLETMRRVWSYCASSGKHYSARLHYILWKQKRGV